MKIRLLKIAMILSLAALIWGCARESMPRTTASGEDEAAIAIALQSKPESKSEGEGPTVQADSFWIELYNARAIRLYSKQYKNAKNETIKVNAGKFRLIAFCGDTLGAGFGKAYYVADTTFTVHSLSETGGQPELIRAIARPGNLKLALNFGENLRTYYSDYYAVVRHVDIARKHVKFTKKETRSGYMPAGRIFIEVFAQLAGRGMQDGGVRDSLVYFRSDTLEYSPGDFATFNIDCPERTGPIGLQVLLDNTVSHYDQMVRIPATTPPFISFRGKTDGIFQHSFKIGAGARKEDVSLSFGSVSGIREAVLQVTNSYLTETAGIPSSIDILNVSDVQKADLANAGINMNASYGCNYGYVNIGGLLPALSLHSSYNASNPNVATFMLKVKDAYGQIQTSTLDLKGEPIKAIVHADKNSIWGWKIVEPYAILSDVDIIPDEAELKLLYSADGNSWREATKKSISGNKVYFNDATGLPPGSECKFRVMAGGNTDNVSEVSVFTTEHPEQLPNSGFEEFTEQATEVPTASLFGYVLSKFTITWWQPYAVGGTKFWAVNSLVSIRTGATVTYQDYKSYPTVAVFSDGAYSGHSVQVATIAENNAASDVLYGTYHPGEIFIGRANDEVYSNWAKTSEGGSMGSRPRALRFQHKFNCNGSKPYYVHIEILDDAGNVIGQASKNDQTSSVNSWTAVTMPINYSVTDRKAAGIKLSFMSSRDGSDDNHRSVTVNTLSGEHKIHAGNILSLDDIELVYAEQ
ncbi:MAG: DUF4493 domain-containing protein [Bacteroidales bacterium]|nr:DUF4493 domain-containing protein [Bacteroidales bacterium]